MLRRTIKEARQRLQGMCLCRVHYGGVGCTLVFTTHALHCGCRGSVYEPTACAMRIYIVLRTYIRNHVSNRSKRKRKKKERKGKKTERKRNGNGTERNGKKTYTFP